MKDRAGKPFGIEAKLRLPSVGDRDPCEGRRDMADSLGLLPSDRYCDRSDPFIAGRPNRMDLVGRNMDQVTRLYALCLVLDLDNSVSFKDEIVFVRVVVMRFTDFASRYFEVID